MFCLACFTRCIWTLDTRLVETFFAYLELILSTAASVGLCLYSHKYRSRGGRLCIEVAKQTLQYGIDVSIQTLHRDV